MSGIYPGFPGSNCGVCGAFIAGKGDRYVCDFCAGDAAKSRKTNAACIPLWVLDVDTAIWPAAHKVHTVHANGWALAFCGEWFRLALLSNAAPKDYPACPRCECATHGTRVPA